MGTRWRLRVAHRRLRPAHYESNPRLETLRNTVPRRRSWSSRDGTPWHAIRVMSAFARRGNGATRPRVGDRECGWAAPDAVGRTSRAWSSAPRGEHRSSSPRTRFERLRSGRRVLSPWKEPLGHGTTVSTTPAYLSCANRLIAGSAPQSQKPVHTGVPRPQFGAMLDVGRSFKKQSASRRSEAPDLGPDRRPSTRAAGRLSPKRSPWRWTRATSRATTPERGVAQLGGAAELLCGGRGVRRHPARRGPPHPASSHPHRARSAQHSTSRVDPSPPWFSGDVPGDRLLIREIFSSGSGWSLPLVSCASARSPDRY